MDISPAQIRQQLSVITASEAFVASQRSRRLLDFLVEETLAGRGDRLKGFYIACEFLGRGADFDPLIDPIVRIEMGKLRRALEHYYLGAGRADAFRVEIPKGNYQPQFLANSAQAPEPVEVPAHDGQPLLGRASLVIRASGAEDSALAQDFAGGLAEQLSALLNRLDDVYVLAADAEDASSARFLLQLRVRGSGERLRVSAQLDDRLRGLQVWAESFTETATDVFALEDELARRIANQIADPNLGEMFRALGFSASEKASPSPEEIVARFNIEHMRKLDDQVWQGEARRALERLVEAQPDFAAARAALSKSLHDAFLLGEVGLDAMAQALEHARQAVRLEPESQHALAALTNACIALGERDRALQAIERGLALNSTGHSARAVAAIKLIMLGEAERAEALLAEHQAIVGDGTIVVVGRALLAWLRGEHAAALDAVSRQLQGQSFWGDLVRAVGLAETGQLEAANQALAAICRDNLVFARDPRRYLAVSLYRQDWQEKILASLGKAGLQEPLA